MTTLGHTLEEQEARRREHAERLLDEALGETFPASDPISVIVCDAPPAGSRTRAPDASSVA